MFYPSVDLHASTRLTSVRLTGVDSQQIVTQLRLPVNLLHLQFWGCSLFTQQHHQCLTSLTNLKSISLSLWRNRFRVKADHLPLFPPTLRHLQLLFASRTTKVFMRNIFNDSTFIAILARLRHLMLPNHEASTCQPVSKSNHFLAPVSVRLFTLSDDMRALLSKAPYLSVVDFVGRPHGWLAHGESYDSLGSLSSQTVLLQLPTPLCTSCSQFM